MVFSFYILGHKNCDIDYRGNLPLLQIHHPKQIRLSAYLASHRSRFHSSVDVNARLERTTIITTILCDTTIIIEIINYDGNTYVITNEHGKMRKTNIGKLPNGKVMIAWINSRRLQKPSISLSLFKICHIETKKLINWKLFKKTCVDIIYVNWILWVGSNENRWWRLGLFTTTNLKEMNR